MLDCDIELVFSRKLGVGARRQVSRASGSGRDGFGTRLSELAQLLTVRVFELEPSEQCDKTSLERRVVYVVTKKMRTTYFLSFVRAEPRDDEAGPAVARAPTHVEEVLGVLQEGTDANSRLFRELRAIRRLEHQVAVVRVPLRTRRRRKWIGSSRRCRRRRLRQALARRVRNGAVNCGGGHQKRSLRRDWYGNMDGVGSNAVVRILDGVARSVLAPRIVAERE